MPRAASHARQIADRLLERWREQQPVTTFSMGLAVHRPEANPTETFKRADEALYAAKRGGRNRLSEAL
ncbi:diguanylate cyclase [Gammaproteobacteria bacterium AB-CW1]|uniref:diguanylate cyclase n=1 Tax=Natronospira elongata TaxID=3110268 RepID=A0AAP6JFX7_9GAMM|nr:diguanylate cyclase [Gammaproteobacteria bacterium AB-CW1]